jgi:foldase protein PrsA
MYAARHIRCRRGGLRRLVATVSIVGVTLPGVSVLVGCSADASGPVAVRIGDISISEATVSHWASTMKLGSLIGASLGRVTGTPREKALDFLLSANWLIGEASEQGLAVSDAAVARGLKERMESVPNGRDEFEQELASTGQTTDDVRLEIKAELAAGLLRNLVASREPGVTSQEEVTDYYHRNIARFRVPERRLVDLIESIDSPAAAIALGERLGPGERFAKRALRESVARQSPAEAARDDNAELVHAIFDATPGKIAAPARFNGQWVLIVARRSIPGRTKSLKEVEVDIERRLLTEQRRELSAEFIKAYRAKWTARTDCRPGFVVQKCSQYRGALKPEGDPLSSG